MTKNRASKDTAPHDAQTSSRGDPGKPGKTGPVNGTPAREPGGPDVGSGRVEPPVSDDEFVGAGMDRVDPADRTRGLAGLQGARLGPPLLVLLFAASLALIAVIVIFGGLV